LHTKNGSGSSIGFSNDFGYCIELLGRDEIDERSLAGLRGLVKIRHTVMGGTSLLNLDGLIPASQWEETEFN
jgi:hypothetical protein